jgi:hypothetical protein
MQKNAELFRSNLGGLMSFANPSINGGQGIAAFNFFLQCALLRVVMKHLVLEP